MIRSNLATRPFYNEGLVTLVIGAVAVVALAATAYTATRSLALTRERAAIRATIAADRQQAERLTAHAVSLQRGIDRPLLAQLTASTHEANELIEERTFSWSTLLARLEKTMPLDVRLVSVTPHRDKDALRVAMAIVTRTLDNVADFVDALAETGVFYDVSPTDSQVNDDGTVTALVDASYLPSRTATEPADSRSKAPVAAVAPAPTASTPSVPARDAARSGGRR